MDFDLNFLALAAVFFLAYVTETAIGFGSNLVALTLGAQIYPLPVVLPIAVAMSPVMTSTVLLRHRGQVDWNLLLRRILPWMLVGLVLGLALTVVAAPSILQVLFGLFVVTVSLRELVLLWRGMVVGQAPLGVFAQAVGIVGAGVIHGAFATGGPLLVYVLAKAGLAKSNLRSTLVSVWLILNSTLSVLFLADGRLGLEQLPFLLALFPVVAIAVPVGSWVHGRLNETQFRALVAAVLLAAGSLLLLR